MLNKYLITAVLLLLALSVHAAGDTVTGKLEEIYKQYGADRGESSESKIRRLIKLDQDLRRLINKPWTIANRSIDKKYWKDKHQIIGVSVGHYSDSLEYSGKLLVEAKSLDVNSAHGSYTHYADICGGAGSFAGVCDMPNLKAALQYEKDFPKGPFIEDTLITIANFYDDLFKALKERDTKDYKYECFSKYMNDRPITEQLEHARKSALGYYTKVLALDSDNQASNKSIREWKSNLESGDSHGWHFCAD
jgi:hypothetical protein